MEVQSKTKGVDVNESRYFALELRTGRFSILRDELVAYALDMPDEVVVWERRSLVRKNVA